MPVPVPCFSCLFVSEIYFWKYFRNALEIFVDFLCAKTKYQTEGEPEGRPTGQVRPPTAGQGGPVGGARPCPWGLTSRPSDAYKLSLTLKREGGHYFPETRPRHAVILNPSSGSHLKLIPALCRRGDRSRRALHRHAFLRDDV